MSRARLVPSLNYRSKGVIDMSIPNSTLNSYINIQVAIASNINDAQSAPINAFKVGYDEFFSSDSVRLLKRGIDENNQDVTRFVFDLNDYATPFTVGVARIPGDEEVSYIRIRAEITPGVFTDYGPIVCVPPYDFFSTSHPTFTCSGNAPDLGTDAIIPDNLGVGCMNLHLPYYSQSIQVANLSSTATGTVLFLSFHPGMSPTIVRPGEEFSLTGAGAPELFLGSDGGTPLFTVRTSLVNMG